MVINPFHSEHATWQEHVSKKKRAAWRLFQPMAHKLLCAPS